MPESPEDTPGAAIYRVAVPLPFWFAQFELAAIIRQRTNFNCIISQLDHRQ
jgi:hypothetical protein